MKASQVTRRQRGRATARARTSRRSLARPDRSGKSRSRIASRRRSQERATASRSSGSLRPAESSRSNWSSGRSGRHLAIRCRWGTRHGRVADQATSSVRGLIAVNADSADPPELGHSTQRCLSTAFARLHVPLDQVINVRILAPEAGAWGVAPIPLARSAPAPRLVLAAQPAQAARSAAASPPAREPGAAAPPRRRPGADDGRSTSTTPRPPFDRLDRVSLALSAINRRDGRSSAAP